MPRRRKTANNTSKAGNGQGSIYYENSGKRWIAAVTLDGGKIVRRIAHSREDAEARLEELRGLQEQQRLSSSCKQTLTQFLDNWLDGKQHDIREHSYQAYRQHCQKASDRIGHLRLDTIRPMDVDHYKSRLLSEGYKPNTVIGALRILEAALQHAVDMEVITRNPCDRVSKPTARPEKDIFTLDELRRLLSATTGSYWHALWVLLATGGFRIGEVLAFQWSHYDEDEALLRVRGTVVRRRDGVLFIGPPKTRSALRDVAVSAHAKIVLAHHKRLVLERHMENRKAWREHDLIFPNRTGGLSSRGVPSRVLKTELKRLGIPDRSPHAFRHDTVSRMLGAHENITVVQELHGHANPSVTLRHYSHVDREAQRGAVERHSAVLFAPSESAENEHEKAE